MKFEFVEVTNWLNAIRGIRNSWESWDQMDSRFVNGKIVLGEKDLKLALKLSRAGKAHDKFLRQIFVSVDITGPEYWWKEADTYKVGTVANSTSMMHTLGKRELTMDDFQFDDVNNHHVQDYLVLINRARNAWVEAGQKKPSAEWRLLNQLTAISFLYRRTFTCNYAVLKSMYHDREHHRLSEWQEVCQWIDTLPYAELITLK